jgi:hypothetical protein
MPHPEYRQSLIKYAFPKADEEYIKSISELNLEEIENYGVVIPATKVYSSVSNINKAALKYPQLLNGEYLPPSYILSCYTFISIMHNLHKITVKLAYAELYKVNPLYRAILNSKSQFDSRGYSLLLVTDKEVEMMAYNALAICAKMKMAASESHYLEVIMALQEHFEVEEQWALLTGFPYEQVVEMITMPSIYVNKIIEK